MADNDFSTLFELLPIGAYRSSPEGQQIRANPALVKLDGYETEAELLAATKNLAQEWYVDPTRRDHFKALLNAHGKVLGLVSEVYRHKSRERIWVRVHAHVVRDAQGEVLYYEGTVEDITELRRTEEAIRQLAFHDPLTGLPNRRPLMDRLQQSLAAGTRNQQMGVLLFLDLDKFKTLNDEWGHSAGDSLLEKVGKRLQDCVRAADTVARLGGDEFIVLLPDAGCNLTAASAHARTVGLKILQALQRPFDLGQHTHHTNCSVGAVVLADPAERAENYLKQADTAMYQAKTLGGGALQIYKGD